MEAICAEEIEFGVFKINPETEVPIKRKKDGTKVYKKVKDLNFIEYCKFIDDLRRFGDVYIPKYKKLKSLKKCCKNTQEYQDDPSIILDVTRT